MNPWSSNMTQRGSKYWNWVKSNAYYNGSEYLESSKANPDVLSDEQAFWREYDDQSRMIAVNVLRRIDLTVMERKVVNLVERGVESQTAIASRLKISRSTVRTYIARIRKKITEQLNKTSEELI